MICASALAVVLAAGLAAAPASAGPADAPPTSRIRPSQLPVGLEPAAAWLTITDVDLQTEYALNRRDREAISVGRTGMAPSGLHEARGGWLVGYQAHTGGISSLVALVGGDGESRVVARTPDASLIQLVSPDGRTYVTSHRVRARGARYSTVLRQVRISDGRVLAKRSIAHERRNDSEVVNVLQATSRRVLLERVGPVGEWDGPTRYTMMWWTPATGKVSVVWRRTQSRPDPVVSRAAASPTAHAFVARESRHGQTVRDLRTRRPLWRLPAGEHAVDFSPGTGVLLTQTVRTGPDDVSVIRARGARDGHLVASYRGTFDRRVQRWETPRTFLILAADGVRQDEGEDYWHDVATIRCSVVSGTCQRVPIVAGSDIALPPGHGY